MKKIISLLVVLAMLMAMAPAVLATGTGTDMDPYVYEVIGEIPTYFELEAGQTIWIQAPVYGATVTLTNADEFAFIGVKHPMTGMVASLASTNGTGYASVVLDSTNAPLSGEIGDVVLFAVSNENPYAATSVGLSVSFDSGNGGGGSGTGSGTDMDPYVYEVIGEIPAYYDLEAGQTIWIQAPVYGATVTLTNADEFAFIGVKHPMTGMVASLASTNGTGYASVVLDSTNAPLSGEIGDVVLFAVSNENPYVATTVGLSVSFDTGNGGGGGAVTPDGSMTAPFVIESLEYATDIVVGQSVNGMDVIYMYTAEKDGTIEITDTTCDTYIALNSVDNFDFDSTQTSVEVAQGDVVYINICTSSPSGDAYATVGYKAAAPGTGNTITGTATQVEDMKYTVSFIPEQNGTLTITVGDGNTPWVSDVMEFTNFSTIPGKNGTAQDTYTIEVVAGTSYMVRIYGQGEPCAAISNVPYSIVFTPSGEGPAGPQLEEYVVAETEITEPGTYDVTVSDEAQTTLYTFAPTATGTYKIELVGSDVAMSEWHPTLYNKVKDAENGVLTATITAVGQSYFIGLSGDAAAAQIKITKTGEAELETIPTEDYKNTSTPVKFNENDYILGNAVNITDSKVDTAVLGTDGYYHLNSADGPVLIVDFNSKIMNITEVFKNGATSYPVIKNDETVKVIKYQDALGEYLMVKVNEGNFTFGNKYHPLTADLMEILKNIGENNDWYGEGGHVGATEDAWMFACVTKAETKVEITEGGITTVPEAVQAAGLKTPEAVKDALLQALITANKENVKENVAHYDVTLMYSADGKTWDKVDATNFPANGKLTVTLPYPKGTDSSYTFTVAHMFTSDAFGKKPGDIETPKVTNTKDGIQFEVTGLSPISVAWTAPENPKTGDAGVIGFAAALLVSSFGMVTTIVSKKKEN